MDHKNPLIDEILARCRGQKAVEHYLAFFECFNRQLYFEAHEVLEHIWLPHRNGANGLFYKGLIQLAGAFVHVQKSRPGPANALFKLAAGNLEKYAPAHEGLHVQIVLDMIAKWRHTLESGGRIDIQPGSIPVLSLETSTSILKSSG
jgi:predicted metal-dependent hydrolase